MAGLYSQFKTDENTEKKGIILEYGLNSKDEPIQIRIARAGGGNTAFNKLMEAKVKPFRRQIQNETIDNKQVEQIMREVYADTIVLGWDGVEDENNDPLEFTRENAIKLFTDLPDLFRDIQEQSQRSALFRSTILETDRKN